MSGATVPVRDHVPNRSGADVVPLVGLQGAALLGAAILMVLRPSAGNTVAVCLALAAALCSVTVLRLSRPVIGRRAYPRWYVAVAPLVVLLVLVVRGLAAGWSSGWSTAVAVGLLVAPLPLVAAIELPLWQALRRGEGRGITLRSTAALAPVTTLALDGIDTLVLGKVVSSIDAIDADHHRNLQWFAGALAHAADTPIAHAVAVLAKLSYGSVTGAVTVDDEIIGSVDRHPVRLSLATDAVGALAMSGPWDVVAVEVDGRPLGTLTIADALRKDAATDIAGLRAAGSTAVLVAPAEDARAGAIATEANCELATTPPAGAAVLTASDERLLAVAEPTALRLGPHSDDLRLAEATIGLAAPALAICRAVTAAWRRGARFGLALGAVGVVAAAAGILTPWSAATWALASAAVVGVMTVLPVVNAAASE